MTKPQEKPSDRHMSKARVGTVSPDETMEEFRRQPARPYPLPKGIGENFTTLPINAETALDLISHLCVCANAGEPNALALWRYLERRYIDFEMDDPKPDCLHARWPGAMEEWF